MHQIDEDYGGHARALQKRACRHGVRTGVRELEAMRSHSMAIAASHRTIIIYSQHPPHPCDILREY